ncbi:inositol polyphosphate 5-phosphatase Ka isoform X1 [Electrophorus electricus]|uniref:inositol polyphosphate 5-phosphatase Ka isoform X1 n=1 Tax=Electrophorus electricus TaxID=8005 RepID=UPI0015D06B46|nr:inositol polyphosphate 5-phosphatase Ka isoform X1 [Electrophorus electricus]XP_026880297.2 inositol polyphosphate 5-phosphatase Ka isoform X1 [Electrophorus electricus]
MEETEAVSNAMSSVSLDPKSNNMDTFRLYMVTWNVATAEPPDDVSSLLQLNSTQKMDLYVIGLQEVRAAPLKFLADLAFEDSWTRLFMNTLAPLGYIKVASIRMQGLLLLLFSKLEHVPFIRDIRVTYTRTGICGYWGNKGGVTISLSFYGYMICFLNCHLAAHMKYATERVDEFEYILDSQSFDGKNASSVLDHKVVFCFGDLNFRIEDHGIHFVRNCITSQNFHLLWSKDQLTMMKKKACVLQQFDEGPLNFPPTYKFDLNSDNYDSRVQKAWFELNGKKRKPAWCDRILWRVKAKPPAPEEEDEVGGDDDDDDVGKQKTSEDITEEYPMTVALDVYTSNMEYGVSDHKPVIGVFSLELRKLYNSPLVCVSAEGDWSADQDAVVTYSLLQPFPSSTWDWVGLYKVGFKSISDYITYTWVKDNLLAFNDELIKVYVSKEEIPVGGGECVLCYYCSNLQCILGISEPFKVHESRAVAEGSLLSENTD